jgi:hypothetical protein
VLPVVTLSKRTDKALKVDFKFPDNSHLVYEGVMNGKERLSSSTEQRQTVRVSMTFTAR